MAPHSSEPLMAGVVALPPGAAAAPVSAAVTGAVEERGRRGSGTAEVRRVLDARRGAAGWLIAVFAGVIYAWGIGHGQVQPYYSAAVRSMALNWKAFFYGGFD